MGKLERRNYQSDFDAILPLYACAPDGDKEPREVGWPDYDWEARFYTEGRKTNAYVASCKDGVCTNCFNDNGQIHVVFKNHRLGMGLVKVDFRALLPNDIYPDGKQLEVSPQPLDIELVADRGDCGTIVTAKVMCPYIKFKYEDLTDAEKAEISKPATDAAASVAELEKVVSKAEEMRVSNERHRIEAEAERHRRETLRIANETARSEAETNREEAETGRVSAEEKRAEEFATWENEIDNKANKSELSNVIAQEPLTPDNFPDINTYTKEDLIDEALIAQCKAVDPNIEWNSTTHRFKYNGLEDLTVDEMRKILFYSVPITSSCVSLYSAKYPPCRTLVPTMCGSDVWEANAMFQMCSDLVTIKLSGKNGQMAVKTLRSMFGGCYRLKEVYGVLKVNMVKSFARFAWYCDVLEGLYLSGVSVNLDMGELPKWRLDCIEYLITNAANTAPITITLHPDAYARVTDEIIAAAASKNITIASA